MRRLLCSIVALFVFTTLGAAQDRKRVAVLDFEYGTVHTGVSYIFGATYDLGKGIRDVLVEELVKGGKYAVIERAALDKVLTEQNFSNSDRANITTAAKLGQILGVDAIIIGSVTEFGRDDKSTKVNTGGFGGFGGILGGVKKSNAKAVTAVTARMIDVDTAEILGVATGRGESSRSGTSLTGVGYGSGGGGIGDIDMTSANFAGTLIGEAVTKALTPVAREMEGYSSRIESSRPAVDALVADFSNGTVILNVGSRGGVRVGDKLLVKRLEREIKDPATGAVIRRIETALGEVVITEADDASAVGTFSGATPPKVGDAVKSQ